MIYNPEYWNDVSSVINNIPLIRKLYGKRLLITGSTGMVCSSIVDIIVFLNKKCGAEIHLMLAGRDRERIEHRFSDIMENNEFEYIQYDATKDMKLTCNIDYIIHGASNANPALYFKEPVETLIGNILGLNTLLKTVKHNPGSRLLYISSSEVYGNKMDSKNQLYKEGDYGFVDILNPRSCYPNGKRSAETLCVAYGQEYDVDTVIVRLGHIYGPSITKNDTRASAAFTRDVLAGHNIVMKSAGEQLRSYCYTLDCAAGIITVLLNGETGNAYNISNKNSIISIKDMAKMLADEGGVKVIYENPSYLEKKSYNMMNNSALDASKLEKLGWKAIFDLNHGVKQTLRNGEI